ncbi:MAG TPA: GAF domain-containing sensor histidine kinase [Blastocatellia bacterium]|nr:GAF domain-containing sensor histidine kinase [Blastocatellia bacterium]
MLQDANKRTEIELQVLAEIHELGRSRLPLPELLDAILHSMIKSLTADAGAIQLLEADQFVVRSAHGLSHNTERPFVSALDDGIAGKVKQEQKPIVVTDAYRDPTVVNPAIRQAQIKTLLAVPLFSNSTVIGVVQVDFLEDRNFADADIEHFERIAHWAAAAIERNKLDSEIDRSRDALKELTSKLTDRVESERRRLSRELHDQAGQSLTAILIRLDLVSEMITDASIKQQLKQIETLAEDTVEELRRISRDLRPAVLDDLGLEEALEGLASTLSGGALSITLMVEKPFPRLPEAIEIALYRIAQEALNNVIKHAQATVVAVRLHKDKKAVHLEIKDNGIGLASTSSQNSSKGIGLVGMEERARSLQGKFNIDSVPENGTRIRVEIPL